MTARRSSWGLLWVDGATAFAGLDRQHLLPGFEPAVSWNSLGTQSLPSRPPPGAGQDVAGAAAGAAVGAVHVPDRDRRAATLRLIIPMLAPAIWSALAIGFAE